MIIEPIFIKNSCMRIRLLVSARHTLYFHHSDFYLGRILLIQVLFIHFFITPASIYTVLFSSLQLLLNKDSFTTPASINTVSFSSLQFLFIQCAFHQSRVYLSKRTIFNKSQFYWRKPLFS